MQTLACPPDKFKPTSRRTYKTGRWRHKSRAAQYTKIAAAQAVVDERRKEVAEVEEAWAEADEERRGITEGLSWYEQQAEDARWGAGACWDDSDRYSVGQRFGAEAAAEEAEEELEKRREEVRDAEEYAAALAEQGEALEKALADAQRLWEGLERAVHMFLRPIVVRRRSLVVGVRRARQSRRRVTTKVAASSSGGDGDAELSNDSDAARRPVGVAS